MDIFFTDPTLIPLPPEEVRILALRAEPWPDNRRVRVHLEITPFQQRPNGNIIISNAEGEEVANISIIETIDPNMEFTLHLRRPDTVGAYNVTATIFYEENDETQEEAAGKPAGQHRHVIVDQAITQFSIRQTAA